MFGWGRQGCLYVESYWRSCRGSCIAQRKAAMSAIFRTWNLHMRKKRYDIPGPRRKEVREIRSINSKRRELDININPSVKIR
jgi:hypothetical protein